MANQSSPRRGFNYLYFGIYFLLLVLMSASGIFAKDSLSQSRFFFLLYALGQAALETSVLIFIAYLLEHFGKRIFFTFFIGFTFALFVLHFLDFLMDRILDLSVWEAISLFVIHETFSNFLYLLDASGIPIWAWVFIFSGLSFLPLLGIFFYKITEKYTKKKILPLRFEYFPLFFFCLPSALFFWDFSGSGMIHPNTYTAFLQSLPWKFTFLQPKSVKIHPAGHLGLPPSEEEIVDWMDRNPSQELKKKPNIYFFVIESFRSDVITPEIAPHLYSFKESISPIEITLSNANASHQSWFSIFHSQFSLHWNLLQKQNWKLGSPPLQVLKNLGYQIHLYSSAQLEYYGMESLLFGEGNYLLNSYQKFHHAPPLSAAETDALTIQALQKDLLENPKLQQGQVFLIFWDSTHFDYSWPKNWPPKFIPFANELSYFKMFYSKKRINRIKNRYRNAVYYVDHLFGQFLKNIPNKEEAIIVVTGDHGEEFFEHGHLFHGSHLVKEQTQVPMFLKLGKTIAKAQSMASQMDIFPTIIDYLNGSVPSFLGGESILRERSWPYTILSRFNAGRTPYEFCIHNGKNKMIARFSNRSNIEASEMIQIMALQNASDQTLSDSHQDIPAWVEKEFGPALNRLFK